ncbi:MAG: PTS sugar transporter subunit IIA [Deltaproteobacteria bacterium]|nr:MAG: PTS sugar transporter subunit IIA [Deltaproteobacteria bacterium]
MIGLVVATHGPLGEALLATAAMIVGPGVQTRAVSLSRDHSPEELRDLLAGAVGEVESGAGVLVMADMFGGTPANIGMTLLSSGRVELLTGVNLPMLLKFMTYRERYPLQELAALLKEQARDGILLASETLRRSS